MSNRDIIAKNIAKLLNDGDFVNLGVGIPTLVSKYVPYGVSVTIHGENGSAGLGGELPYDGIYNDAETLRLWSEEHRGETEDGVFGHKDLCDASGNMTQLLPGACCFDSCMSFAAIRGGHLDVTVLGGMQVDVKGNLANWMIPGKREGGMGGAMDLVAGAKKVIIALEHTDRNGAPKLIEECTLPLTGKGCVDMVVTELCMIKITDKGFLVTAMSPHTTEAELRGKTGANLRFMSRMRVMEV